jgi:hypothetical protein
MNGVSGRWFATRALGLPAVTLAVPALAGVLGGFGAAVTVGMLAVLEISMSFDNAVVNATVLRRLDPRWQRRFLTIGVIIAVAGMRLVFPLLVVALTARLGPLDTLRLALSRPAVYAHELTLARPAIAAFGGMFLLMIFLEFVFDDRERHWLAPLERGLARLGRLGGRGSAVPIVALLVLLARTRFGVVAGSSDTVLVAGVLGVVVFLVVKLAGAAVEAHADAAGESPSSVLTGRAALVAFLYLELLDASFSFDGVIGAFAISTNLFVIAAGLGVGALYVRTLTVRLVRRGTIASYVYLEHGAHYAIGALGVVLLTTIGQPAPEGVTGLIGIAFIVAAVISSLVHNRRAPATTIAAVEPESPVEDARLG